MDEDVYILIAKVRDLTSTLDDWQATGLDYEKRIAELEAQNEALIETADRYARSNYPGGCRDLRERIAELEADKARWEFAKLHISIDWDEEENGDRFYTLKFDGCSIPLPPDVYESVDEAVDDLLTV